MAARTEAGAEELELGFGVQVGADQVGDLVLAVVGGGTAGKAGDRLGVDPGVGGLEEAERLEQRCAGGLVALHLEPVGGVGGGGAGERNRRPRDHQGAFHVENRPFQGRAGGPESEGVRA